MVFIVFLPLSFHLSLSLYLSSLFFNVSPLLFLCHFRWISAVLVMPLVDVYA